MAGAGAHLLDLQPNRILVAVDTHFVNLLDLAGGIALAPERPPAAAVVMRLARLEAAGERLRIHIGEHQDLARLRIGGHGGQETVGIEFGHEDCAGFDLGGLATGYEWRSIFGHDLLFGTAQEPPRFRLDSSAFALTSKPIMSELYNTEILRLASEIPFTERLAAPQVMVRRTSRICGSRLTLDADFEEERLARLGLEVKACALGQASTSLVAPKLIGHRVEDIAPVADAFRAMLEGRGEPPEAPWDDLAIFLPLREHRSRHGSVMLIFEAALSAFEQAGIGRRPGGESASEAPLRSRRPSTAAHR